MDKDAQMVDTLKRYLWKLLTYTRDYPTEDDKGKYCWIKTNRLYPTEHLCRIASVKGEEPNRVVTLVNVERDTLIDLMDKNTLKTVESFLKGAKAAAEGKEAPQARGRSRL